MKELLFDSGKIMSEKGIVLPSVVNKTSESEKTLATVQLYQDSSAWDVFSNKAQHNN